MRTGLWFGISGGCQLTLSVKGRSTTNPQFVGGARFVPDQGDDEIWDVTSGPHVHTFADEGNATVRVGIRFISTARRTATVEAKVTTPHGHAHNESSGSEVWSLRISGKKGDGMQRATLVFVRGEE